MTYPRFPGGFGAQRSRGGGCHGTVDKVDASTGTRHSGVVTAGSQRAFGQQQGVAQSRGRDKPLDGKTVTKVAMFKVTVLSEAPRR